MIELTPIGFEHKEKCDAAVFAENSPSADFCFGNLFIWQTAFCTVSGFSGGRMLSHHCLGGRSAYAFPIGTGDLKEAVLAEEMIAASRGYRFVITYITEAQKNRLEEIFPGKFEFRETPEINDYIYDIEKLCTYSGKALHGKKNHCNRFEAEHDWHFEALTEDLIPVCAEMYNSWEKEHSGNFNAMMEFEEDVIDKSFIFFDKLGFDGGVLFADDEIMGFTIGERCSNNTYDVHIEKARADINGAYPMVCREFSRMINEKYPEIRYINREDDMGLESLRRSKESYKPEFMVKKYVAFPGI